MKTFLARSEMTTITAWYTHSQCYNPLSYLMTHACMIASQQGARVSKRFSMVRCRSAVRWMGA